MTPPAGISSTRIRKFCDACGAMLAARHQEARCQRAFNCQTLTADLSGGLPHECCLRNADSPDSRAALKAMSMASWRRGAEKNRRAAQRAEVALAYVKEVGSGEPSVSWYRDKLGRYHSQVIKSALAKLPYWKSELLRFSSLKSLAPIDKCVARVRAHANDVLADLLAGYVEHHYELMEFGFANGLYGSANPVKLSTLHQRTYKIANYLEWLHKEGHEDLQQAGRSVFDQYITEKQLLPSAAYQISKFYDWARKKHRFIPPIRFNRRKRGKPRAGFEILNLNDSRTAYGRICAHSDPQGRALALLALLYAQRALDSVQLKRSDLRRSDEAGRWLIARPDAETFAVEPELSQALDECLALADRHARRLGPKEDEYIFPGNVRAHMSAERARERIVKASGVPANVLRRTAIVNMYRGGQKTMGTVVLREVLNVSIETIHQAIKLTGESVNSPSALEEAEALRRAFLEGDDD